MEEVENVTVNSVSKVHETLQGLWTWRDKNGVTQAVGEKPIIDTIADKHWGHFISRAVVKQPAYNPEITDQVSNKQQKDPVLFTYSKDGAVRAMMAGHTEASAKGAKPTKLVITLATIGFSNFDAETLAVFLPIIENHATLQGIPKIELSFLPEALCNSITPQTNGKNGYWFDLQPAAESVLRGRGFKPVREQFVMFGPTGQADLLKAQKTLG